MPSTDSITSSISINQLTYTSTSASAHLITVPRAVQINQAISTQFNSAQQVCIAACELFNPTSITKTYLPLLNFRMPIFISIFVRRLSILPPNPIARDFVRQLAELLRSQYLCENICHLPTRHHVHNHNVTI